MNQLLSHGRPPARLAATTWPSTLGRCPPRRTPKGSTRSSCSRCPLGQGEGVETRRDEEETFPGRLPSHRPCPLKKEQEQLCEVVVFNLYLFAWGVVLAFDRGRCEFSESFGIGLGVVESK